MHAQKVLQWKVSGSESRSVMSNSSWPHGLHSPWISPGKNTGVGSLSLLQGIFPTQGSNRGLLLAGRFLTTGPPEKFPQPSYCWRKWSKSESYSVLRTLCDPMDYRVHGILQSWILEWVAFLFSRGSSQPRDWTQASLTVGGLFTSSTTSEALWK